MTVEGAKRARTIERRRHVEYVLHRVNMLREHGVEPFLVFDGGKLPAKAREESSREEKRAANLDKARRHAKEGNHRAAMECYQRAVDITPEIVANLARELEQCNVKYIVAPYEADAQMAYLQKNGLVDVVITEDSDLLAYGCARVFFKMDKFGHGQEIVYENLPKNRSIDLSGFTPQMFQEMCVLSGCDFLQTIPGVGPKTAYRLMNLSKSYKKVLRRLRYDGKSVPDGYAENFEKALMTFRHQRVFDPIRKQLVHLEPVPPDAPACLNLDFLGPIISDDIAAGIAKARIDPMTFEEFEMGNLAAKENRITAPVSTFESRDGAMHKSKGHSSPMKGIKKLFSSAQSTDNKKGVLSEANFAFRMERATFRSFGNQSDACQSNRLGAYHSELTSIGKRVRDDVLHKENSLEGVGMANKASKYFDQNHSYNGTSRNRQGANALAATELHCAPCSLEDMAFQDDPVIQKAVNCDRLLARSSKSSHGHARAALEKFTCSRKLKASGLRKPKQENTANGGKSMKQVSIESLLGFRFKP